MDSSPDARRTQKTRAYSVHLLTASGIIFAFAATVEVAAGAPDPRWVFLWLLAATIVDALDGPLARRWDVKTLAPRFDGRTIDDIVDYLTFTFIPLLLVWRLGWVASPAGLWTALACFASLLGFSNTQAKQEAEGFFLGFPSYWNIYAFYAGLWHALYGTIVTTVVLVVLALLTIAPVRFVYPNLAPKPWRRPVLVGAALWAVLLLAMLPGYPDVPAWLFWLSLVYPAFYAGLSLYLDFQMRSSEENR